MASKKTCFKCQKTKPITDFYKHFAMGDGHLNKCKECTKADTRMNRSANADYYRAYDRDRASLPHRKEKAKMIAERWQKEHPERRAAHMKVLYAIRSGKMTPLPCWICGEKAEAHHPDYSQPLDVVWLCPVHHKQAHVQAREVA